MTRKLGKYELLQKLGEGATSSVYLACDPFAQRQVAIKVASPEILKDPEKGRLYSHLFMNEASLVGKLTHPHIVQIFDAVVAEKLCYIVMEYVAGGTLDAFARADRLLAVDRVVEIIFKCTRALDFAQRLGITHRDIKPANILLIQGTDIKISDFGAAITGRADQTVVSGIGSPAYMSPEQLQEEALDHRTDIYSLGVVLFQLLTGRLPYEADNQYQMIYQIMRQPTPLPTAYRPDLAPVFDHIVQRAMAKKAAERYQKWEEFSRDLASALRDRQLFTPQTDFAEAEKFDTLRALPFFADFSDVEIWEVLRFSHWRRVESGTAIMQDGEPGDFFCFLTQGEAKVTKGGRALNVLSRGDCFGEMAVIGGQSRVRGADVTSITPADIVTIRGEALQQASDACRMHFYRGFLEVLAARLTLANQRLSAF